jgi:hypothetical protein
MLTRCESAVANGSRACAVPVATAGISWRHLSQSLGSTIPNQHRR